MVWLLGRTWAIYARGNDWSINRAGERSFDKWVTHLHSNRSGRIQMTTSFQRRCRPTCLRTGVQYQPGLQGVTFATLLFPQYMKVYWPKKKMSSFFSSDCCWVSLQDMFLFRFLFRDVSSIFLVNASPPLFLFRTLFTKPAHQNTLHVFSHIFQLLFCDLHKN